VVAFIFKPFYKELKKELVNKGYEFKTTSDTEVIIYLYQEYGESCFDKLNGIFALAIFDRKKDTVILARDHFGVKPLGLFKYVIAKQCKHGE